MLVLIIKASDVMKQCPVISKVPIFTELGQSYINMPLFLFLYTKVIHNMTDFKIKTSAKNDEIIQCSPHKT